MQNALKISFCLMFGNNICFRLILGVACCYSQLFSLYTNIKIGKIVVKYKASRRSPVWEIAVNLAVAGSVYDGVFECCPFSLEMSWMESWT